MPADDDAFERAARREREIAEEIAHRGLSADEAEQLQDLLRPCGAEGPGAEVPRRLTTEQLREVIDNGLDPELLGLALGALTGLTTDEVIEVLVDFCPEEQVLTALAEPTLAGLDRATLVTLLEHDLSPADVGRLRRLGVTSAGQLARMCSEGVEAAALAALLELGVGVEAAIDLAVGGVDPAVLRRMFDQGLVADMNDVADSIRRSGSGPIIGVKTRGRHIGLILGDHVVGSDATVSCVVLGNVTVAAGVRTRLDGWVGGDVIVGPHARVHIAGSVRGSVRSAGGEVTVSGTVRGGVHDEDDTQAPAVG
ncbi:MAG TPA: hypothetical protein VFH70_04820 [Acidimicrobiales bacterium]|nr:hypothetical protein [Acidimicrobiales bacterium]